VNSSGENASDSRLFHHFTAGKKC